MMKNNKSENNNNVNNMSLHNFITENNLEYEIIALGYTSDNKKEVCGINKNIKTLTDPNCNKIMWGVKQKCDEPFLAYKINLKSTDIFIIDIDEDISLETIYTKYPILKDCYYTTGNRKGFHFYCKSEITKNKSNGVNKLQYFTGDFIKETIWERADKNLYGNTFINFETVENIKVFFQDYPFEINKNNKSNKNNNEIKNLDELKEIVLNIPVKFANDYNDWIKIISILKVYNLFELANNFSQKSKKYTDIETFKDWYNNKTINIHSCSIGTIYEYSKNNLREFNKIKKKYKLQEIDETNSNEFENKKVEFEKTHFKIINKGLYIRLIEDKIDNLSEEKLIKCYKHLQYLGVNEKGMEKKFTFIKDWITTEDIRKYDDFDTYPNRSLCPENYFNLWTGYKVEQIKSFIEKQNELEIILNHVKILCNHNLETYEYVLDWVGHLFKYPEEKIGILLLFISKEGCGKGTFLQLLKNMMGSDKLYVCNDAKENVFGKFNSAIDNKILVDLEELGFMSSAGYENKFKSIITEPTIEIQYKGQEPFTVNSFHRFIATSNDDIPIKTTTNDRRKLIIECSNELIGNVDYFNKLNDLILDKDLQATFHNYLINRPSVDTFFKIGSKNKPVTEIQEELQTYFKDHIELFITFIINKLYGYENINCNILGNDLYKHYVKFCETNKFETYTLTKFGLKFSKFINGIDGIIKIKKRLVKYEFTFEKLKDYLDDTNICTLEED